MVLWKWTSNRAKELKEADPTLQSLYRANRKDKEGLESIENDLQILDTYLHIDHVNEEKYKKENDNYKPVRKKRQKDKIDNEDGDNYADDDEEEEGGDQAIEDVMQMMADCIKLKKKIEKEKRKQERRKQDSFFSIYDHKRNNENEEQDNNNEEDTNTDVEKLGAASDGRNETEKCTDTTNEERRQEEDKKKNEILQWRDYARGKEVQFSPLKKKEKEDNDSEVEENDADDEEYDSWLYECLVSSDDELMDGMEMTKEEIAYIRQLGAAKYGSKIAAKPKEIADSEVNAKIIESQGGKDQRKRLPTEKQTLNEKKKIIQRKEIHSTFCGHKVTNKPFNADELDCLKKHEHYKLKQEYLRQRLEHEEEKKRSFRARPIPNFIVKVQERNWRRQQLIKLQQKKKKDTDERETK